MRGKQKPTRQSLKSAPCTDKMTKLDAPLQKIALSEHGVPLRKRTEKACDQCRRRKTKCDGRYDCKTCIEVGLDCSYGNRTKQARGPTYVAHLERRLKHLESEDERRKALDDWKCGNEFYNTNPQTPLSPPRSSLGSSSSSSDSGTNNTIAQVAPALPGFEIEEKRSTDSSINHLKREASEDDCEELTRRKRTASQILAEAKHVLDGMSATNYTARCAAECLASINQTVYQTPPLTHPIEDFPLFGPNGVCPDQNIYAEPFNAAQYVPGAFRTTLVDQTPLFASPTDTPCLVDPGYLSFHSYDTQY